MFNQLLFISGPEIFVVFIVVLLLFGSKKIPEVAKGLGKGLSEFKKATDDIKKEINDSSGDVMKDIREIQDTVNKKH
ncbi:MAG TPA: twin-arginine translocase TatA/TatE family subunit [Bacteroidales bacterium]|nr:twin-arginine translocase TatA/TatE family subunit [Bacteroidales bacterium]